MCKIPVYDPEATSMRLLVRSVEFFLFESEVSADHDGTTAREISENKKRILSLHLK